MRLCCLNLINNDQLSVVLFLNLENFLCIDCYLFEIGLLNGYDKNVLVRMVGYWAV